MEKVYVGVTSVWAWSHRADDTLGPQVSTVALNQALCICVCFCGEVYVFGTDRIHQPKFVKKFALALAETADGLTCIRL